jgi:hypothetical protein
MISRLPAVCLACCLVLGAASQRQHCGDPVVVMSKHLVVSTDPASGYTQLHIPFRFAFSCPGVTYGVAVQLQHPPSKYYGIFRHRFTQNHLAAWLGGVQLVMGLPEMPGGDHIFTVQIFDAFPLLDPEDVLIAAATGSVSVPTFTSPLKLPVLMSLPLSPASINSGELTAAFRAAGFDIPLDHPVAHKKIPSAVLKKEEEAEEDTRLACEQEDGSAETFAKFSWFLNVWSQSNYTQTCCQFGTQFASAMEGAALASDYPQRGWVTPSFISQPRCPRP